MVGDLLIADGVATNRIVLKTKLAMGCYTVSGVSDCSALMGTLGIDRKRLVLLDAKLPKGAEPSAPADGLAACAALKARPETATMPIILTVEAGTLEERQQLRRAARLAGADAVVEKPIDEAVLLARVRSLLRSRDIAEELALRETTSRALGFAERAVNYDTPGRIALVSLDLDRAVALRRSLEPLFGHSIEALTPARAMGDDTGAAPDLYVAMIETGAQADSFRLMSELRSRDRSRHAGMMVVLDEPASEIAATALDLGAWDVMNAPVDPQELALSLGAQMQVKRRSDRLRQQVRTGLQLAVSDPLTGLYNRRYALSHLARIEERARQTARPYAVMMLDLDRFKEVNDRFGHAAGDAVLKAVSERINANLRSMDMVARIGGEEFLVVLPETGAHAARAAAARLCKTMNSQPIDLPQGGSVQQTVSIGVAIGGGVEAQKPEDVIDRADKAMLSAKARGRNRVRMVTAAA